MYYQILYILFSRKIPTGGDIDDVERMRRDWDVRVIAWRFCGLGNDVRHVTGRMAVRDLIRPNMASKFNLKNYFSRLLFFLRSSKFLFAIEFSIIQSLLDLKIHLFFTPV